MDSSVIIISHSWCQSCLVWVTIGRMKLHDQKQLGEETVFWLTYPKLQSIEGCYGRNHGSKSHGGMLSPGLLLKACSACFLYWKNHPQNSGSPLISNQENAWQACLPKKARLYRGISISSWSSFLSDDFSLGQVGIKLARTPVRTWAKNVGTWIPKEHKNPERVVRIQKKKK